MFKDTLNAILIATLFSLPIYLNHYQLNFEILNTVIVICSLYFIIRAEKRVLFRVGFFSGILWFYWVSFSFIYYQSEYLIPFVILFFGLTYAILFYLIALFKNPILRALIFGFGFDYIEPFGFNWFKPDIILVHTLFSIEKFAFIALLISISLLIYLPKRYKILTLLIFPISFISPEPRDLSLDLNIYIANRDITQDSKWQKENLTKFVEDNFKDIDRAIERDFDLIIFPESAFPLFLNLEPILLQKLKDKSKEIVIVTGSLKYEDEKFYNSTYIFQNSKVKIGDKVVLVPFGEKIPLPKFMREFISETFFNGAKDYEVAKEPTDFEIGEIEFRSAICYEITTEAIYKDAPNFIIAISNNAWFYDSIEPTLQNMLIKLYSRRYNKQVFHSINYPKES